MTLENAIGAFAALWGLSAVAWRVTCRKLGLGAGDGWQATPRRIARTLIALNFLVMYPLMVALIVVMLALGDRDSIVVAAYGLFGIVALTLPIPRLVAKGRRAVEGASAKRGEGLSVWLDGIGPTVQDALERRNPYIVHCLGLVTATVALLVVAWLRRSDLANVAAIALGLLAFYLLEKGQAQ